MDPASNDGRVPFLHDSDPHHVPVNVALAVLAKAFLGDEDPAKYAVEIDEAKASIKSSLAKQIEKGLEIRPVKGMSGMKLSCKDGSGFYDFSDEEIAALLKPFLGDMKI